MLNAYVGFTQNPLQLLFLGVLPSGKALPMAVSFLVIMYKFYYDYPRKILCIEPIHTLF